MNLQSYLEKYINSAHTHGAGTDNAENYRKVNKAYKTMMKNFTVLIKTEYGKDKLKDLLNSPDEYVSSWTATLLVFDYPEECKEILRNISKKRGAWAGSVRIFLEELEAGNIEKMY